MPGPMDRAREVLRDQFGFEAFRSGQEELVKAQLEGRDCLGVMPTGAGKSLCYQIPALAQEGIAIVISPLVSLMADQVRALVQSEIPAALLNSQLTSRQQSEVLRDAREGFFKLLYVAPERLDDPRFVTFAQEAPLSLIAVDEAHCVSQWGQDFRPSYLGIGTFVQSLPTRPPVAAFTATATPRVANDIVRLLDLHDPVRVTTGFDRPNLHFEVEQLSAKRKLARIAAYALAHPHDSGIVYCSTRKETESLHEALCQAGVRATRYHAGLPNAERACNQKAFVDDDAPVMVATNAFGMGIDKSNVRYVIHNNMPGSLEAYYQEAGRAGRDGEPSDCLLFWNDSDIATARFFIEQESGNEKLSAEEADAVRSAQRRRLEAMVGYCLTTDCLRATILRYFGDSVETGESAGSIDEEQRDSGCGNCGNCEGNVQAVDVTTTARSVMRCVHELRGRYGKGVVADVLRGSSAEKIREWGLDRAKTFGIVEESSAQVKEIIELLTAGGYLDINEGRYPLVGLGPRAREAATDEFRLYMKKTLPKAKATKSKTGKGKDTAPAAPDMLVTDAQKQLFERLRALRKSIADAEGVPPYIVFSDAALRDMCVRLPHSNEEFLEVSGVGEVKLARYGKDFLAEIAR